MRKRPDVDVEIAGVGDLTRHELATAWVKQYGCPPPKGVKRGLLERSAAWHLQAKRFGGLPSTVKKALVAGKARRIENAIQPIEIGPDRKTEAPLLGSTAYKASMSPPRPLMPKVGSRLMREWNGRMHVVEVTNDGFV